MIRRAILDDISQIVAINKLRLVAKNELIQQEFQSQKNKLSEGFLLGKLDEDEVRDRILDQSNNIALVNCSDSKVLAYLLAYNAKKLPDDIVNKVKNFDQNYSERILYYHQIAKLPGSGSVGRDLVLRMLDEARSYKYDLVFCKIVHAPPNQASIKFHTKIGFKEIGEIIEGQVTFGIYSQAITLTANVF